MWQAVSFSYHHRVHQDPGSKLGSLWGMCWGFSFLAKGTDLVVRISNIVQFQTMPSQVHLGNSGAAPSIWSRFEWVSERSSGLPPIVFPPGSPEWGGLPACSHGAPWQSQEDAHLPPQLTYGPGKSRKYNIKRIAILLRETTFREEHLKNTFPDTPKHVPILAGS